MGSCCFGSDNGVPVTNCAGDLVMAIGDLLDDLLDLVRLQIPVDEGSEGRRLEHRPENPVVEFGEQGVAAVFTDRRVEPVIEFAELGRVNLVLNSDARPISSSLCWSVARQAASSVSEISMIRRASIRS